MGEKSNKKRNVPSRAGYNRGYEQWLALTHCNDTERGGRPPGLREEANVILKESLVLGHGEAGRETALLSSAGSSEHLNEGLKPFLLPN